MAALIVAVLLVPQSLAYAVLAGLPPETGLYASIFALAAYGFFGSSNTLSVAPVAVVSLLTAAALSRLGLTDRDALVLAATALALLTGLSLLLLGFLRLGFMANFISQPVISAFINAAVVIIAVSQLRTLLGVEGGGRNLPELLSSLAAQLQQTNWPTLLLGLLALTFSLACKHGLRGFLQRLGLGPAVASTLTRCTPLMVVAGSAALVYGFNLPARGVHILGELPTGLPGLKVPPLSLELLLALWSSALLIAIIGFVESISVAQTLAAKSYSQSTPNRRTTSSPTAAATVAGPAPGTADRPAATSPAHAATVKNRAQVSTDHVPAPVSTNSDSAAGTHTHVTASHAAARLAAAPDPTRVQVAPDRLLPPVSTSRARLNLDQELVGLGSANIASAVGGGLPVAGGFARSVVNFEAGAATPAAGLMSAVILVLVVLVFTPLLYWIPLVSLAVIILTAITALLDFTPLRRAWVYSKTDFAVVVLTFVITLTIGVEIGIAAGIIGSLLSHLYKTSQPHVAIVGRVPGTEHFRNIDRHQVETFSQLLSIRIDESLYFANTRYLEQLILQLVTSPEAAPARSTAQPTAPEQARTVQPGTARVIMQGHEPAGIAHVILQCSAVNDIDLSALETLEHINAVLLALGIKFHLSEVKGPVMDRLLRTSFLDDLSGNCYLSHNEAVEALRE